MNFWNYCKVTSIHYLAVSTENNMNTGIWFIKIVFECEHVDVLKQSSFMHSLFARHFNLACVSGVFIFTDFPCK